MNLFIDTNIFLSFYHLSSDDLEELRKLGVLITNRRVTLFLPTQVVDEFRRNREVKIADALKRFTEEKLNDQFPQICKEYEEYARMRTAILTFKQERNKLVDKLNKEIVGETLKADKTIAELFGKARQIEVTSEIVSRARRRVVVGNPPGKADSTGDAINWQCLLDAVPEGEEMFFISDDGDYSSPLDKSQFMPFLQKEWSTAKKAKIRYFSRLSAFFKSEFPEIQLASELEKELLIRNLAESSNFASTRALLKQLVAYDDFTETQVNDLVQATLTNNQISWIADDADINRYLKNLILGRENKVERAALQKFLALVRGAAGETGGGCDQKHPG